MTLSRGYPRRCAIIDMMTRPYSYQKWQTARVWPGGGWGEALSQVRKDQQLTQRDIAEYVGVGLSTVRQWEDGLALPDRSLWPKLEEAMGVPAATALRQKVVLFMTPFPVAMVLLAVVTV